MEIREVIDQAFLILRDSNDRTELRQANELVNEWLKESWLNELNTNKLKALDYQLTAKRLALDYLYEGYVQEDLDAFLDAVRQMREYAALISSEKMDGLSHRLSEFFREIGFIMEEADVQAYRVRDYDWNVMTSNRQEAEEVRAWFDQRIKRAEALPESDSLFVGMSFVDAKGIVIRELAEVRDFAEKILSDMEQTKVDTMLESWLQPLDRELASCNYFQNVSEQEHKYANTVVVCTPFAEELEIYAGAYGRQKGVETAVLDFATVSDKSPEDIERLFENLQNRTRNLVVKGLERYRGEMRELAGKLLAAGKRSDRKLFIMDPNGDKRIYNTLMDYIRTAGSYTSMDVAFFYLGLPSYNELTVLLENSGMLDSDDLRRQVKTYLPFGGYLGLNRMMEAQSMRRDWLEAGRRVADGRRYDALQYLSCLPSQALFLNTDWGDYKQGNQLPEAPVDEIDYDSIRDVNPANLKKILQGNFTMFEKCGLICRYCLTHGEDVSIWQELDDIEAAKRLKLATGLVMHTLGVPLDPIVTVLEKIKDNPNTRGLCIGGGKEIQFQRAWIKDLSQATDTICHESFHAFQHTAMHTQWKEWYWRELGVTRGRIEAWMENNNSYFDGTEKKLGEDAYTVYRVQIFECDARAFASDCLIHSEAALGKINWE